MRIVEIKACENNGHRNQIGDFKTIPEGWAVVPDSLETPNFPFGNIVVEEINGVMTVTQWTACPCPESKKDPVLVNSIDLSSYYAFCASVNSNSIDCAFGKNNEDRILNLGLQLAMYAWFCGDSKTEYPFTELCNCCKLTDIETNDAAFKELWENTMLRNLYMGGDFMASESTRRPYPSNRVISLITNGSNIRKAVEITKEDISNNRVWLIMDCTVSKNTTAAFYFNDVLVTEWVNSNADKTMDVFEGIAIKLSDYGITTPGSYNLENRGTSTASYDWRLYRKTISE